MLEIKVLGSGCPNCKRVEQIARKVVDNLAVEANIEKVTNFQEILDLGVMATPGLIINDKVVSSGRIPSEAEVTGFIEEAIKLS
jgi:small redox-active disulfide protein 2